MSAISSFTVTDAAAGARLYRAVWRWHFYAGLVVVPFLIVLALTGLIMVYGDAIETFYGPKQFVAPAGDRATVVAQAAAAASAVPGGAVSLYVHPAEDTRASVFIVDKDDAPHVVVVDPHGPRVLGTWLRGETWFYWASNIHGTLLLGTVGDRLVEIAAGLGILLVGTGLYLWWPRNGRTLRQALVPNLALPGRAKWKELHGTLGFYVSIVLLFFLLSGLAWTGVWGAKITQAWSTFPAAKWDNVPLSDKTHASMNHGAVKEVPWGLEETPMPASGSAAGADGIPTGTPVDLDSVSAFARALGFTGQFRVNLPSGDTGVYTISADTMNGDANNPLGDRTVHIDQYTGKVLADVTFAEYGAAAKAMAVGVALHQGNMGWWNSLLNAAFCLSVMTIAVTAVAMWWKRRPAGSLGAPLYPRDYRIPRAILLIGGCVALAFPLTGIAIVVFAVVDFLLPKQWKEVGVRAA